ncbi:allophanate hydrolase [Nakamurella panacisegetis]|uniref:Allophanate hydrolase n=1 Tax=Nakamurella panacisegetis TaxID=1090615 RepID=A0A1H0MUB1_9ACTN|nr:allophanate hydrolase [Nakamurella panacisegetis]SDO84049.1 allophanate hydrolase [Nakamurella panacisegetis]
MTGTLAGPFLTAPIPIDLPATERVRIAYRRMAAANRPEVWITVRDSTSVLLEAAAIDARVAAGEALPLAGRLIAVKDNIDVAGLPTTAACPEFAFTPDATATAIARLVEAGGIVLGKANLDQFATGLVGVRSPYGAVRCAWDPQRVSGGSSSGSAVAVALGIADIGIGTDTAGSGRVPAAFHGLIGVKATLGLVPTTGVLPACIDYDCVTVFAQELALARQAIGVMVGPDRADPRSRVWPPDVPLAAPSVPRIAVPRPEDLQALEPGYRRAFDVAVADLAASGCRVDTVDISGLLDAARLLYDGAIVAERYSAVGEFLSGRPAGADPTVSAIVLNAGRVAGPAVIDDQDALLRAKAAAGQMLSGFDGLLLPTTTEHPTIAAVRGDPVAINRRLGTFTNFCNLLDMAAVAFPAAPADGAPFGVMMVVPAFHDQVALDLAARFLGQEPGNPLPGNGIEVSVFGAHLRGQPLNRELQALGARFVEPVQTSDAYRLVALDTVPAKPGLVRVLPGDGAPIAGERWLLSPAALGTLLATLPAPMSLTSVELADGRWAVGFGCSHQAALDGSDITRFGGWAAYLANH